MTDQRGQWRSKAGFILAGAGSAVGLANVWAFPFRTGQNGGAAFVLIYLVCTFLICLPFMMAEINLGRFSQKNAIGAIKSVRPKGLWLGLGLLCVTAGFFILSFYGVVAGWSLGYVFKMLIMNKTNFGTFAANPWLSLSLAASFFVLTVLVVYKGVQDGIERWSKLLMPTLIVLMAFLIFYGLTLPNAGKGLSFFLEPDFSKVTGKTIMTAMGQAFFSLSLGIGGILTYGSYLSKNEDVVTSAIYIVLLDIGLALMAGLMIFPALFAFNMEPSEGPALVFVVLPQVFQQLPAGNLIGMVFFVMLSIAALTSTISMLEILVSYFVDERGWRRSYISWLLGGLVFLFSIPSALSSGAVPWLTHIEFLGGIGFLEMMIFLWFDIFPPLGALLFSIFIGWVWGIDQAANELGKGNNYFTRPIWGSAVSLAKIWGIFIRYVCPLAIASIWFHAA